MTTLRPDIMADALLLGLAEYEPYDWPIEAVARMAGVPYHASFLRFLEERGLVVAGRIEQILTSYDDAAEVSRVATTEQRWVGISDKGRSHVRRLQRRQWKAMAIAQDISSATASRFDVAAFVVALLALIIAVAALFFAALSRAS